VGGGDAEVAHRGRQEQEKLGLTVAQRVLLGRWADECGALPVAMTVALPWLLLSLGIEGYGTIQLTIGRVIF
jgi:hypothetical protein